MFKYEEENDLESNVIVAYMDRKHEIILDILRLLKELGFPSDELEKYVNKHGIGQVSKITHTETSTKSKRGQNASFKQASSTNNEMVAPSGGKGSNQQS